MHYRKRASRNPQRAGRPPTQRGTFRRAVCTIASQMLRFRWVALALLFPGIAQAQSTPTTAKGNYSQYEDETIRNVSKRIGSKPDAKPEGKTVEAIDVYSLD